MKTFKALVVAMVVALSGCTVLINSDNNEIHRTTDVYDPVVDVLGTE